MRVLRSLLGACILIVLVYSSQAVSRTKTSHHLTKDQSKHGNEESVISYYSGYSAYLQGLLASLQETRSDDDAIDSIVDDTFDQIGRDDDEKLTWAEFQLATIGVSQETGAGYPEYEDLEKTFRALDEDNNGALDWTEVRAGVVVELDRTIASVQESIDELNQSIGSLQDQIDQQLENDDTAEMIQTQSKVEWSSDSEESSDWSDSSDSSDDEELLLIQKAKESVKKANASISSLSKFASLKNRVKSTH